ncbi:MAG: EAL domain-containing protein [Candidatus Limiplasma sp.]|nr:EAL domain-containing protein [Candidatus Limiplasma sp.]
MSRRLMIVEEDTQRRASLRAILEPCYELLEAPCGTEALRLLKQTPDIVECVLLSLSCTCACEFLNAKRLDTLAHMVPVLGLCNPDDAEAAQRALKLDVADITYRPVQPELLLQRVRNLIRLQENMSLRRALERDPLTGIFNRHTFDKRTARLLRKKQGSGCQLQLWDVERFKVINDQLGTAVGDRVLRAIARYLDEQLRGVGTYARLESDRFALCYPQRLYEPRDLVDGVNQRLEELGVGMRIALYAGIYNVEDTTLSVDQMCDRASMALKTVKGNYHRRFAFYDSAMRDQLMLEQSVSNEMNLALQQGQFCFYLQPLYSITTGEPNSAEALVRWNHPTKGLIPPRDFIPLFERNGFITRLDVYLWESVCKYLHDLKAEGLRLLPISVNVSRLNLFNPHLCEDIRAMVARYELDPSLIKLEITESAYTDHPEQLLSAVRTLRSYGFEILMDDFGSGYSSLSMLKDLPVDILKVDMRFITGMENNGRAANVMASIIRMAKWLEIIVVAEGVETQAQVDFLRSIGCDEVQGYYYARPMPTEEFTALLRNPEALRRENVTDRERLLDTFDLKSLWDNSQPVSLLFNGMVGAMALYEKTGDKLEVLRVNEGYYELTGSTPQSLLSSRNALQGLEPADRQTILNACNRAAQTHGVELAQVSVPHTDGHLMWLDIKLRHLGRVNLQDLYYFALTDMTHQKELEHNFLLYQYGTVMLDAYSEVRELNYTDNLVTSVSLGSPAGGYHAHTQQLDSHLQIYAETRVHPEDQPLFASLCDKVRLETAFRKEGRRSLSAELRLRTDNQLYQWARLTLHPIEDAGGKFRALLCNRNIDEQKQSEQMQAEYALLRVKQQEQERYQIILEQTQTALFAWTPDAEQAEGNKLAQTYPLCALSCRQLFSGILPEGVAHPEDQSSLAAFFLSLQDRVNASRLVRLATLQGDIHWCRLNVAVQRGPDQRIATVLATVNDVDQEHRTQLQLDQQREQAERRLTMLSHLYWTLPCGILQLDLHDPPRPVFFNRACWELFGFASKEDFDEVADRDLFSLIAPDDRDEFLSQLRRCRERHSVENIDVTIVRPHGALGSLRGNAALSHMADGRPMVQLVLLDTTVQREQERRLEHTRATLERTSDMLQHLLENLPVGVTLFELGHPVRPLYVNSRAFSMFGLKDHQSQRFMELLRLENYRTDEADSGGVIRAVNDKSTDLGEVMRVARDDGATFWLRTYYTIVPQASTPPLCYAVLVDVSRQVEMERAYNRQSELYRITMEDSRQIFFDYDLERDVMNYTVRLLSGEREDRVVPEYQKHLPESAIIHPDYIPDFIRNLRRFCRTRDPGMYEFQADYQSNGEFRWYRAYFRCLADERGALYRMIGRVVDIQDEKAREKQLGQATVFRRAVDSVSLFVFAFDLPGTGPHLLSCEDPKGAGFAPYLHYLDPAMNQTLVHPDDREALCNALDAASLPTQYRAGKRELTVPFRALNRHQQWIWLEMNLHLSQGESRKSVSGIGYVKMIEALKKLEIKASIDGLTQLLNRSTAEERIDRYLQDDPQNGCLLILDVDNFKEVNDQYGHLAGDALLSDVAGVLRTHLRQSDIVGRLGGDEFVALLRNATLQAALEKGRELLAAIEQINAEHAGERRVTCSIGVAGVPADGQTFAALYSAADQALYQAKRQGKNRCCTAQGSCDMPPAPEPAPRKE